MHADSLSPPAACTTSPSTRIEPLVATQFGAGIAALRAAARDMLDSATRRDPEIVHQARVTVRRMRAALCVFADLLAKRVPAGRLRRARKALVRLGSALGEARDWDVILTQLLPERRAALQRSVGREAMLRLARQAQLARARANTAARRFVASERFESALTRLADLQLALERPNCGPGISLPEAGPGAQTGARAAQRPLERQSARVLRLGSRLVGLEEGGRHRLRIQAKRLRYSIELCVPLFPGKGTKQWLRTLKGLQDALGEANNARMLAERLGPLGADAALGKQLDDMARRDALKRLPEVAALFMAWRLARSPWKS